MIVRAVQTVQTIMHAVVAFFFVVAMAAAAKKKQRPLLGHYILDADHNVQLVEDFMEWAIRFEQFDQRRVAETTVRGPFGKQWVSTVFIGLDHRYGQDEDDDRPLVFETMIFGGPLDQNYQDRHCTWQEALVGHALAVSEAKAQRYRWIWFAVYLKNLKRDCQDHFAYMRMGIQPQRNEHEKATTAENLTESLDRLRGRMKKGHA